MNLKKTIAKVYLPSSMKFKGLSDMYCNLAFFLHSEMKDTSEIKKAAAKVGKSSAETLIRELNLKNTFEDAVDSWIVGSKALNVTLSLERKEGEVVFTHVFCPMWEFFRKKKAILCEDICIPAAEALAKEVCSHVEVRVVRKPDMDHTCIKSLKKI